MKINYSIVGLGRSGNKIHYKSLNKINFFNLIGVCDSNYDKLKALNSKKKLFKTKNYKEIASLVELKLVVISTNTNEIFKIAKFFFREKNSNSY